MTSGAFRLCRCGVLHQAGIVTVVDAGGSVDPFGAARRLASADQPLCRSFRETACIGPCGPAAEQPLNVRVAIALGFTARNDTRPCLQQCVGQVLDGAEFPIPLDRRPHFHGGWMYWEPTVCGELVESEGEWQPVPDYTEDWSVTGPLIARHLISLVFDGCRLHESCRHLWCAVNEDHRGDDCVGPAGRPLEAVCELLLKLSAEGKLLPGGIEKGKVVDGQ